MAEADKPVERAGETVNVREYGCVLGDGFEDVLFFDFLFQSRNEMMHSISSKVGLSSLLLDLFSNFESMRTASPRKRPK